MFKVQHIAKLFMLTAVILLLVSTRYACAQQNTGSSPYYDSEHSYRVSIGDAGNDREWIITDGTTSYNLTDDDATIDWSDIIPTGSEDGYAGEGYYGVKIYFDHTVFTSSSWSLNYYEYDASHNCTSARTYAITLTDNTFYLALAADEEKCNSQDGVVHAYSEVDDETDVFTTSVSYTITMTKNDEFDPTSWDFDVEFSQSVDSIKVTVLTTNGGTAGTPSEITAGTKYNIEITPSSSNVSSVEVEITAYYSATVLADVSTSMTLTNGEAIVSNPPAPDAVTDDNITDYTDDRVQAITILKIPSTGDIAFGEGETSTSAANPLQNSTHRYVVQLGDIGNLSNTGTEWTIKTEGGVTVTAGFTLNTSSSTAADTAIITFSTATDTLATGNYVLYFTEVSDNGCSSVREYSFTIGDPLDVDIVTATSMCADSSGVVNNLTDDDIDNGVSVHETTTTVDYVVNLNTSTYYSNWYFTFTVTSDPAFDPSSTPASDLELLTITSETTGVSCTQSETTGTVVVTNSEDSQVKQVTITVTYNGMYQTAHAITVTLTDITGSFSESDADATNSTTHTIYAMPQAGELAGVD